MIWLYLLNILVVGVYGMDLRENARSVWECMKTRDLAIDPEVFLIHRPNSEIPGDAVSEGVGYGLLTAYWSDDRDGFDRLLHGAEKAMWNPDRHYYDWRVDPQNQKIGMGAASDAEQDIAAALILAHREWVSPSNEFYGQRAQEMLDSMWSNGMIDVETGIVRPGFYWGGPQLVNPSYLAPAWYRLYKAFDSNPQHDWDRVIDTSYTIIAKSPGYPKGLVPDWMTADGAFVDSGNLGYNAYGEGKYMFKDGIRTLWRIGLDLLWNPEEKRADEYMTHAYRFIGGNISGANFYQMDGNMVPENDVWIFDGGAKTRLRREHSPLTIGMWMIPILMKGTAQEKSDAALALQKFYTFHNRYQCYWGMDTNPTNPRETISQNELYFDQLLAGFGALFNTSDSTHEYL